MVNLKKDSHFENCIADLDAFIQELREENEKFAEIRELRRQNKMLVAEIQKLQNELNKKNNAADSENKTASDLRFERNLKINALLIKILWLEVAAIIIFDIYIAFIK